MDPATWEGVAAEILSETGCDDPPVDALELADCCGVAVVEVAGVGGALSRDTIFVGRAVRRVRKHGLVAHELGHWALRRGGEDDTEDGARFLAGAFLLPRQPFDRDLRSTWDVRALQAKHVNASAELIVRRIVSMRDAVATIWDEGRLRARIVSPWVTGFGKRPTPYEHELADRVLASGEPEQADDRVWAFPFFDGRYRRVITVAEAEQLALRFGR